MGFPETAFLALIAAIGGLESSLQFCGFSEEMS
jgi:hypothetical protein